MKCCVLPHICLRKLLPFYLPFFPLHPNTHYPLSQFSKLLISSFIMGMTYKLALASMTSSNHPLNPLFNSLCLCTPFYLPCPFIYICICYLNENVIYQKILFNVISRSAKIGENNANSACFVWTALPKI